MRLAIERSLVDLDVTQPQFLIMTMINAYPGSSGADIARLTMLTPQTISLILANLERAGRVHRTASPDHGRVQRMRLTENAHELLVQCRKRVLVLDARLRARLTVEEEAAIRRWLVHLATTDLTIDPPEM